MSELRAYFERWQRLEDERKALGDDLKELFAEAKGNGYAPKAMRIAFRSIIAAENESDGDRETAAQVELYVNEITGPRARPAPAHTREDRAKLRTSESMDDTKALSAEAVALGLISPEGHAETVRIADAVARKYGAGVIDAETGEITEQPETANETAGPSSSLSGNETAKSPVAKPMESNDVDCRSSGEQAGAPYHEQAVVPHHEPSGAETGSDVRAVAPHFQPLRKTAADFRPHCQHPERCGSSDITKHCWSCQVAIDAGRMSA